MAAQYDALNSNRNSPYGAGPSPYGSADPNKIESTGYIAQPHRKGVSNWIKIGVPVAILVVVGAVVGGVLGSRKHSDSSSNPGSAAASSAASSAASAKKEIGLFATATNSEYMMPIYPATVSSKYSY